jgi:hypothetical protein
MLSFNLEDAQKMSDQIKKCQEVYLTEWEAVKTSWANLEQTWLDSHYMTFMKDFELILKDHNFIPGDLENHAQKINHLMSQLDLIKSLPHLPLITATESSQSSPSGKQSSASNPAPTSGPETPKTKQEEWVNAYQSFISTISSWTQKEGKRVASNTFMGFMVLSGLISLYASPPIQLAAVNIIPDVVKTIDANPQLKSLIDFAEQGYDKWAKSEEFRREHEKNATRNRREDSSAPLDP